MCFNEKKPVQQKKMRIRDHRGRFLRRGVGDHTQHHQPRARVGAMALGLVMCLSVMLYGGLATTHTVHTAASSQSHVAGQLDWMAGAWRRGGLHCLRSLWSVVVRRPTNKSDDEGTCDT